MKRLAMVLLAAALVPLSPQAASAADAALPRQTAAQAKLEASCRGRVMARVDTVFAYPFSVSAPDGWPELGVYVKPAGWAALSPDERLAAMRDVACLYAGGRMDKRYWYGFSVGEAQNDTVIETFAADVLWPKSGTYR